MGSLESKSIKETINDGLRQFEIGDMKKAMDLFENAKSQIELEMKNPNEFNFEYVSIVINKLCIIYCDYLADFEKAMKMNDQIIKSLENNNNNNSNSSDIYISSLVNKALILEKQGKLEESHIIFKQTKQLFEQNQQIPSKKLYIDALHGIVRTYPLELAPTNAERKQSLHDCMEIAEKFCGKTSMTCLDVLFEYSKSSDTSATVEELFREIETEFVSKSLTNTHEYAHCLYLMAQISTNTLQFQNALGYLSRARSIYVSLFGVRSLPVLKLKRLQYNIALSEENTIALMASEELMRNLVGVRHPEYLELLIDLARIWKHEFDSQFDYLFLNRLSEHIEFPTQPKPSDFKEVSLLFDKQFWESEQIASPTWSSNQAAAMNAFRNSFQLFNRCILISYLYRGLLHPQTVDLIVQCSQFLTNAEIPQKAIPLMLLSKRIAEQLLKFETDGYLELLQNIILLQIAQRDWKECEKFSEKLKLDAFEGGQKSLRYANAWRFEGFSLFKQAAAENFEPKEKLERAIESLKNAISIFEECRKTEDPNYFMCFEHLGEIYVNLEHFEKALVCFEKASDYNGEFQEISTRNRLSARDVVCFIASKKTYKDDEAKRNEYLKAFTGKYSADKCLGSSIPETTSFLLEMLRAHEKCGKPLPFSTINFTEGFIEIQNQFHIWGEEESKQMKELCIEVLHYLIAPEVIASNPKDFGRICIVPLKVVVNTLRMVRLLKSSKQNELKLSDRKRVVLNNIIETIGMKSAENPKVSKYFERILKFGRDRKTLGNNKTDIYINIVIGCSHGMIQNYYNLLKKNHPVEAEKLEKLSNRIEKYEKWTF